MKVEIVTNPKRIPRLNTDCSFYSPLSVQTRITNGSSAKNGYNLNFFDKDKAKRYFSLNSNMNTSKIHKRTRTPSKLVSHEKHLSFPLSIRITNILDNRKKSKSKQSFQAPTKTNPNIRKKTTHENRDSSKLHLNKDVIHIEAKRNSKLSYLNPIQKDNQRGINKKDDNKEVNKIRNPNDTKKKKPSLLDCNDNTLFANEIPDGIRKKMLVYYQANTINYHIDDPQKNNNKMAHYHQKSNMITNTECNKINVKTNLRVNYINNEILEKLNKFIDNDDDHNRKSLCNNQRAASKNKYRELIGQYLSEEESDM